MFTEYSALVSELKTHHSQFQKLSARHEQLDKEIKKKERHPSSAFTAELKTLKQQKLELKQQLFNILKEQPGFQH